MNKSAKEMFEGLRLKQYGKENTMIMYGYVYKFATIKFDLLLKQIIFCEIDRIDIETFKAIQKQIEELGWK